MRKEYVSADWKDIEGLADGFKKAIKEFGLYVYDDPAFDGTDSFGFIISDIPLTKKELKQEGKRFDDE